MKCNELMRAFFRKMVQMCSNFVTSCTIRGTRGAKLPADATFSGRSMVEMLGVLAIIGVLSIGAMTGYSKAMMKYKLNKQAEQLNIFFSLAQQYVGQFRYDNGLEINSPISTLLHLNLIPEEMIRRDARGNFSGCYDPFGNQVTIRVHGEQHQGYAGNFVIYIYISSKNLKNIEMCRNMINTAKEYADTFYTMSADRSGAQQVFVGYKYCYMSSGYYQCSEGLDNTKIANMCNIWYNSSPTLGGVFKVSWKP